MRRVEAAGLPADPLDAAQQFHASVVPEARTAALGGASAICVVFAPADHTHAGWRLAAVQALAREAAPARVNGIASDDEAAIAAAIAYLSGADGVTGQLLALDSHGAGSVVFPSA